MGMTTSKKPDDPLGDRPDSDQEAEIAKRSPLAEKMLENARLLPDPQLQATLVEAVRNSEAAIRAIEACFGRLIEREPSHQELARFLGSWKSTHLKMLGIYGITRRLHRLARKANGDAKDNLHKAADLTGATSDEDLGLDYSGETHADLYESAAQALLGDDSWKETGNVVPEAAAFGKWIFNTMVTGELDLAMSANLFSEIYNDAEYRLALKALETIADYKGLDPETRRRALSYAQVHVAGEGEGVEVEHLLSMYHAIKAYTTVSTSTLDYPKTQALFEEYLRRLAAAFEKM